MGKLKNVIAFFLMFLGISLCFALLSNSASAQNVNFDIRETIKIPSQHSGAVVRYVGDLDDDDNLDIVYTDGSYSYVIERDVSTFVFRSTIEGYFRNFAEIDGDNYPDILATIGRYTAKIFEATEDNTYAEKKSMSLGKIEWPSGVGDSDGDGKGEFLIGTEGTGVHIYEVVSNDTYAYDGVLTGSGTNVRLAGVYDLNVDGYPETVITRYFPSKTYVFKVINGTRTEMFCNTELTTFISRSLGDLDGDGIGEVIGTTYVDGVDKDLLILELNETNDDFEIVYQAPLGPYPYRYFAEDLIDFDRDGQWELWQLIDYGGSGYPDAFALAHLEKNTINTMTHFYNSGTLLVSFTGEVRGLLAIGDTNGDGGLELAVVQGDQIHILEQTASNQRPVANAGNDQTVHPGDAVTLDASGSSDPDGNYPLIFTWTMTSKPTGSSASLTDANTSTPIFTADVPGDYTIELVVTDSKGLSSEADQVIVSTYNSPPVADAGEDQAIIVIGSTVHLGADSSRQSYDDDGDPITYFWTMTNKPTESKASLSDSTSATPTFQADVHGVYLIELVVSDPWISSTPDTVVVSFENVAPVADAKVDQPSVVQGKTVNLDGTGSSDANGDFLYYNWSVVAKPVDSSTDINNPTEAETSFLADVPGEYIVSLVVNDNIVGSDPSNVTIVAISFQDATTETLQDTTAAVNSIDIDALKNKNMLNALTNKINSALKLVDQGQYEEALNKLQNDILSKTNGCADTGSPDKNDWIKDCDSQDIVYPLIIEAIEHLMNLQ